MHRLTVGAVTYVFRSEDDFRIARQIKERMGTTEQAFQAELTKRWIVFGTEERTGGSAH
jgi:hypothetical protein